ncbi:MAG: MFS transporter [Opitutales bacterium]
MHTTLNQSTHPKPARLLTIQALVAFNDNFAKFGLLGLIASTLSGSQGESATTLTAALLIAPFILLAPLASWMSVKYSREKVIHGCLVAQCLICIGLCAAALLGNIAGVLLAFGLLACQSACFSPAKQAVLKEWVGPEKLGRWVAWMGLSSVLGILLGGTLGGLGYDMLQSHFPAYTAFFILGAILVLTALGSLFAFQKYRTAEGQYRNTGAPEPKSKNLLAQLKQILQRSDLRIGALGIAAFYAFGGFLLVCLSQIVRSEAPDTAASVAGIYAASIGCGFMIGSLVVGQIQKKKIADHLSPFACASIAIATFFLINTEVSNPWLQYSFLALIGFSGAGLVIPMQSLIQLGTHDSERGPVLSQVNALTNILSITLLGMHSLANIFQVQYHEQLFLVSGFLLLLAAVLATQYWKKIFLAFARFLARCIYRVKVKDSHKMPLKGGVLLVANHLSWADAVIVPLASPREVRFMGSADLLSNPWIRFIFNFFNVIPVCPKCARSAIKSAQEALKSGDCVCIFPEGGISQTGMLHSLKKGAVLIARQSNAVVVPLFMDQVWGSIFSYSDNRFFTKKPRALPYSISARFGDPISSKNISIENLRDQFTDLSQKLMTNRAENEASITELAIKNLKGNRGPELIDYSTGKKEISNRKLLILSEILRQKIEATTSSKRVGFALPMGAAAISSNLASQMTGKVPVFLNTTTSPETWRSYAQTAELDTIFTVSKLAKTVESKAPRSTKVVAIDSWFKPSLKDTLIAGIRTFIFSAKSLSKRSNPEEATILFTSGSSGTPKGVVLTPANILANCLQVKGCAAVRTDDRILSNLPPFHSFGYTIGCWMPLVSGNTLITCPNPLDSKTSSQAIKEQSATILLATPTFLRSYLKKSKPEELSTLRSVIAGAERLPETLQSAWEQKFQSEILLGYGMTEASPVISLNVSNPEFRNGKEESWRQGKRANSSGRLLPGIRARLVDPETGSIQYGAGRGILEVQGPNVSVGYLHNDSANTERFRDGWLHTGDIVRIDEDGFLFIEGRVSRFAKIGGEMAPLDSIEKQIEDVFTSHSLSTNLAICAKPDEQKGEKLVLFTEEKLDASELRQFLSPSDLPNLWIPKEIIYLESLPKLASGKTDYARLAKAADAQSSAEEILTACG